MAIQFQSCKKKLILQALDGYIKHHQEILFEIEAGDYGKSAITKSQQKLQSLLDFKKTVSEGWEVHPRLKNIQYAALLWHRDRLLDLHEDKDISSPFYWFSLSPKDRQTYRDVDLMEEILRDVWYKKTKGFTNWAEYLDLVDKIKACPKIALFEAGERNIYRGYLISEKNEILNLEYHGRGTPPFGSLKFSKPKSKKHINSYHNPEKGSYVVSRKEGYAMIENALGRHGFEKENFDMIALFLR